MLKPALKVGGCGYRRNIATAAWVQNRLRNQYIEYISRAPGPNPEAALFLEDIDNRFLLFRENQVIVDFGAASGGWSAVAAIRANTRESLSRVIAIDKQSFDEPAKGVLALKGIVGSTKTLNDLKNELNGRKADIVLSDMTLVPDTERDFTDKTLKTQDAFLALVAAETAEEILAVGGTFVTRMCAGKDLNLFLTFLKSRFAQVNTHVASLQRVLGDDAFERLRSPMAFAIGQNFIGRPTIAAEVQTRGAFDPKMDCLGKASTDYDIRSLCEYLYEERKTRTKR